MRQGLTKLAPVMAAALIAGSLTLSTGLPAAAKKSSPANAVVAFIDTGINPYHETFRDDSPRAFRHPSTYIPDYPKKAIPLRLSLDEPNYWAAVRADCERIWSKVKPGQLYWFPGTKIVGAITVVEEPFDPLDCKAREPFSDGVILDGDSHGTMVASRAASNEYGACKDCLITSIQMPMSVNLLGPEGSTIPAVKALSWAADNASWIDAQSNSWGPIVPGWDPTGRAGLVTASADLARAVENASRKHLAFFASGNGVLFRWGVLGHPTLLAPHLGPSPIIVGGHDSGYVNTWPGFSAHVVSDSCSSWAAYHDHMDKSAENVGGGTSGASPFAAGGSARVLLEARRILGDNESGVDGKVVARGRAGLVKSGPLKDGKFTLGEWKLVSLKTASPRPKGQFEDGPPCPPGPYAPTPVKWADVPESYPEYIQIGYGAIDAEAFEMAAKVLRGAKLPDRSETDAYFQRERAAREALYGIFGG